VAIGDGVLIKPMVILPERSTHPSQQRLISPILRKKSGKPSRRLRLFQVGQVPQSR